MTEMLKQHLQENVNGLCCLLPLSHNFTPVPSYTVHTPETRASQSFNLYLVSKDPSKATPPLHLKCMALYSLYFKQLHLYNNFKNYYTVFQTWESLCQFEVLKIALPPQLFNLR